MPAISTHLTPNPASGTLTTADLTTENILASSASLAIGGVFALLVNLANMVAGDTIVLKIYTSVAAGSYVLAYSAIFTGAQIASVKSSPPLPVEASGRYKATLQQTAGSYRAFPWKVIEL